MLILWTAPVGLTFLIAPNILKVKNFEDLVGGVSWVSASERSFTYFNKINEKCKFFQPTYVFLTVLPTLVEKKCRSK